MADTPAQDRKLKLPRTQIGNRFFTKYDPEIALDIVIKVSEGQTIKSICTLENGKPSPSTFYRWARENPQLREALNAAREISAYSFEDEAIETARGKLAKPGTTESLSAARMLIDQLRWSASRRNPKSFSDKGNQALIVPVTIQTTLDLGGDSGVSSDSEIFELNYTPLDNKEKASEKPIEIVPRGSRTGPRKTVLHPRIDMDSDFDRPAYSEAKEHKNKLDRENWRREHNVKEHRVKDNAEPV